MTVYKVYCDKCGQHISTVTNLPLKPMVHYGCPKDKEEVIDDLYGPNRRDEQRPPATNKSSQ